MTKVVIGCATFLIVLYLMGIYPILAVVVTALTIVSLFLVLKE